MQGEIQIIGALDPDRALPVEVIARVLNVGQKQLEHGATFTGRPGTKLYADDGHVVKLRSELTFKPRDCVRWIEQALERERLLAVHHPAKTWFVLHTAERDTVGNVTPLLSPLHREAVGDAERRTDLLLGLLELYMSCALHEQRLDEGLSNFALDETGKVIYLDDDVYGWDHFTTLAQMVGVWFRQLSELTPTQAERLGAGMRAMILKYFGDAHQVMIFAEQLRGVLSVKDTHRALVVACLTTLVPRKPRVAQVINRNESIALLADVHANLPALNAVLDKLDELGVSRILMLGDVVGYGPHPRECIERLQGLPNLTVIKGNHDHAAATGRMEGGFSSSGRWAIEWTRGILDEAQRKWLDDLPEFVNEQDWMAVHGAPCDKTFFNAYVYTSTYVDNLAAMEQKKLRWCFHGHSHIQGCYIERGVMQKFDNAGQQDLSGCQHALICPGSVGQARMGSVGAEFGIFTPEKADLRLFRIPYNVDQTVADMTALGFPAVLGERLKNGK